MLEGDMHLQRIIQPTCLHPLTIQRKTVPLPNLAPQFDLEVHVGGIRAQHGIQLEKEETIHLACQQRVAKHLAF